MENIAHLFWNFLHWTQNLHNISYQLQLSNTQPKKSQEIWQWINLACSSCAWREVGGGGGRVKIWWIVYLVLVY